MNSGMDLKLDTTAYNFYKLRKYQLSSLKIQAELTSFNQVNQFIPFFYRISFVNKIVHRLIPIKSLVKYYSAVGKIVIEKEHYKFDPAILDIKKDIFLRGFWQNEKYFNDIRPAIRQDFQLKDGLASSYYSNIHRDIQAVSSVSIHIRRGDFLNIPRFAVCSNDYYMKAMAYIAERVSDPIFYVFSDDLPWVKENFRSERPVIFVERCNLDCEELLLMSACKHHIIANSTFSWWGAWLGTDDSIVIAPANWFTDGQNLHDFIPEHWVKME